MNIANGNKIDNETELTAEAARIDAEKSATASAQFDAVDGVSQEAEAAAATVEEAAVSPEEAIAGIIELLLIPAQANNMARTLNVWNPAKIAEVSKAAVKVLRKSVWGKKLLEFLCTGLGVEEMALAFLLLPLIKATIGAVRADMVDVREREAVAAQQAAAA